MSTTNRSRAETSDAVRRFERAFAEYQEAHAARAFWMGRVGLYAVLRALGVRPGDRVGICSYTCVAVVEAVTRLEALPVFLDVDRHMNIAPSALHNLDGPIKVLVLQHTFGVPCDLDHEVTWARDRGIPVIEDCCHALGARWRSELVGRFGCAAIFSFQWGKPFTTGQGGMVTFMDEHLACEVDHVIACEGRRPSARASMGLSLQRCVYPCLGSSPARRAAKRLYHWACDHGLLSGSQPTSSSLMGHADRFLRLASAAQSRAGLHQLRKWRQNLQKRVDEGEHLQARLRAAGLSWVEPAPWATPMYLRFPVWVADKTAVLTAADRAGLDIAGWYLSPAHPIRGEALHALGYASGQCPSAEDAFARVVTLPTQPALGPRRLEQAIRIVAGARTGQENTGD